MRLAARGEMNTVKLTIDYEVKGRNVYLCQMHVHVKRSVHPGHLLPVNSW